MVKSKYKILQRQLEAFAKSRFTLSELFNLGQRGALCHYNVDQTLKSD